MLFLVEDNGYAISVPVEVQTPGGDISRLVRSFPGLHVDSIDGTDFFASLRAMREATDYVRARKGPAFVHARVIRPYSHSLSDDEKLYKPPAEREAEARRDPIARFAEFLKQNGLATDEDLAVIAADVEREVNEAALKALAAPKPAEELRRCSGSIRPTSIRSSPAFDTPARPEGKPDTMVAAINRTLKDEMARDARIVVFGEDVADASKKEALPVVPGKGGVFKLTHGLQRLYGDDRVFNAPLAEANIVGRAIGMATRKLKPVVEIQFFDYIWPAMMQIRDEMTMMRYRSGNTWSCPVVIRVPIGGYLRGGGPYHSQSGESIFAHCPGIRIAYPVERRRRRRPAADVDSLRRPGPVPRAQAPVSPDLQQGRISRQGLHDPVRPRQPAARRRSRPRRHLGRARAAVAAGGAAGGEGSHQRRRARPADDRARTTGTRSRPTSSARTASSSRTRIR